MIDTIHRLETPEGIDIQIRPAGPVSRGLALLVDLLIQFALDIALMASLASLGGLGGGALLVGLFLIQWFYPVAFELFANGQTPGKRSLGLRVVHADGTPIGWTASLLRNLLLVADFLPFFYMTGLVSMLCSGKFQRLGDLAAGTLVIGVREAESSTVPWEVEGVLAPAVALQPEEQRAIMALAERSGELSDQRVLELSEILRPLTGEEGADGARALLRIANGLAGRK